MLSRVLHTIQKSKMLFELLVGSYFAILTVGFTYPLIFHMADSVVIDIGDNIYFIWLIGWYKKAIFDLHINPFFNPGLNFPEGWNLATTDTTLVMSFLGLPGSLLFGPTWGYNFAILVSFVLAGYGMYAAVRKMTGSSLAGIVAGTMFAFSPFRWARYLVGHLSLLGNFWFPVYFLAVSEFLTQQRWRWLLASALLALGIGLTAPYYLYMGLIITAVFVAALLFFWRHLLPLKARLFRGAILAIALLAAAAMAMLPYFSADAQGTLADRSLSYANDYSGSPLDFILPINFYLKEKVWDWVGRELEHENALYLGAICMALTVVAWIKRRELKQSPWVGAAVVASLTGVILAMGIYLRFQDATWVWNIPRNLQPLFGRDAMRIPLPGYFLFQYLPFYSKMRALMRFGVFTLTFANMLAGLGCAWLFRRYPARRHFLALILLVGLVFDIYVGVYDRFVKVDARPVDRWLAQQPGSGAVAQFPFSQDDDQEQVYYTLIHGKPFIGGFFSANQPRQYQRIRPVLDAFPNEASVALLKELRMQYILVDASAYPDFDAVRGRIESLGLVLQAEVGGQYVFTWPEQFEGSQGQ